VLFFNLSAFFYFYFSVTSVYVVFMPKILQSVGYSTFEIGIIFAMAPLMRFIVPFTFLKHVKLTKKIFYLALIVLLLSAGSFYIFIHSFWLFLCSNLLLGASFGLLLPYIETYAMEYLKKEKYGKSRLFGSIGFMLIGIILARNLENYHVGIHYFFAAVFATSLFGFLVTCKNNDSHEESLIQEKFELKKVTFIWISLFLMQVSFGAFYNFFTIYETAHGISLETISYLWAFGVICEIIFFYFQAPLLKYNLLSIIKIATLFAAFRWLLLFLFPDSLFITFFSQSFHAIAFALHHTAAISLLYSIYNNKKLAAQFYYGFSFGLGGFLGAILAGYFYGKYLYLYAAIIAFLAFLALFAQKPTALKRNF
jgi:MFS transporter, PPP family, 3-phenylpropionic acid transporter